MNVIGSLLFFLVSLFFALIAPPGAGPDDDFHMASIYCSSENSDVCQSSKLNPADAGWAMIPQQLVQFRCFAGDIQKPGHCAFEDVGSNLVDSRVHPDPGEIGFYNISSKFILDSNPIGSIYLIRALNALVISGLLLLLVSHRSLTNLRGQILLSFLIVSIPFGFNLFGTSNPSLWTLFAIPILWFSLMGLERKRFRDFRLTISLITGIFFLWESRPDGKIFLGAVALTFLMQSRYSWRIKSSIVGFLTFIVIFVKPEFLNLITTGQVQVQTPGDKTNWLHNLIELPAFLLGIVGGRGEQNTLGLGVYDLILPSVVPIFLLIGYLEIFRRFLEPVNQRDKFLIFSAWILLPAAALYGLNTYATWPGGLFQPRYLLPFFALAVAVTLSREIANINFHSRFLLPTTLLSISFAVFCYATLKRYSDGMTVKSDPMLDMYFGSRSYIAKQRLEWTKIDSELFPFQMPGNVILIIISLIGIGLISAVMGALKEGSRPAS